MKPKVFRVVVPVKFFSKHDDPDEAAAALKDVIQWALRRCETVQGELPFDIENITVKPIVRPGCLLPKSPVQPKGS